MFINPHHYNLRLYLNLSIITQGGDFSEEEWRMASLLKADFEKGGVHLDPAGRAEVIIYIYTFVSMYMQPCT